MTHTPPRFHTGLLLTGLTAMLGLVACASAPATALITPVPRTGQVLADTTLPLGNDSLSASWSVTHGSLLPATLVDHLSGKQLAAPRELFTLVFRNGTRLPASRLKTLSFTSGTVAGIPNASCLAERLNGRRVSAVLETADGALRVQWQALLREGTTYIRQKVAITPLKGDADLARVTLVDQDLPGADVIGQVPGSPVVAGTFFTGFEHPMSTSRVEMPLAKTIPLPVSKGSAECEDDPLPVDAIPLTAEPAKTHATCWLELALPLKEGKTFACSSVAGVTAEGQLRRGFLAYTEHERAHPYRTFLHYNSWYDIGYFTPYNEADCLGVINAFADELGAKRGVKMDSFLFDDGWDDVNKGGEWAFHKGFPNGFTKVKEAAAKVGAQPGMWLSPWGGYGPPRVARRKSGEAAGYEIAKGDDYAAAKTDKEREYNQLFALSGPKYYESFHKACLNMVTQYGVNQFKLDGTGNVNSVVPGSKFGSDFEAAIALIRDLRQVKPDIYINLTTGTWPSPFWLPICDSIWRGGEDHFFRGVGSARQRWMTYRDGDTFDRIVRGGPLYPLNSLMLHGILYAKGAHNLSTDPENDFTSEVRSYFGNGTQLQEMYISHQLLTKKNWDDLAECAKWSRANASTLVDTHWVGGNPGKLEVYGWASWSPAKGILTLRNPNEKEQTFTVDLNKAFELPAGAATRYILKSPFKQRAVNELEGTLDAGKPVKITLRPFEVLVFEAMPE